MLTVDFDRLDLGPGTRVLDLGCGAGRHTFEAARRGADVTAVDMDADELATVDAWLAAMRDEGDLPSDAPVRTVRADATALPFEDGAFDVVIAAEILEHLPDDRPAIAEIARVVGPGGTVVVTVPRFGPEAICWALSAPYHEVDGGHVRIYRRGQLRRRLARAGLAVDGTDHVHALHSPYWWLRCAAGLDNDDAVLVRAWHRLLVWDIERSPRLTHAVERVLDPVLGKSLVVFAHRPGAGPAAPASDGSTAPGASAVSA